METPAGRLQAAEASARSNLARALHGSDPARALVELERAVALRRRVLADELRVLLDANGGGRDPRSTSGPRGVDKEGTAASKIGPAHLTNLASLSFAASL
jgi:hypothetical protein